MITFLNDFYIAKKKKVDRRRKERSPEVNDFIRDFGLNLRKIRNAKGWTLEDVEEHGYSSWRHFQQIELGNKSIELSTVHSLAKTLSVPVWKLFKF